MGMLSFLGKTIARPYVNIGQTISRSSQNIGKSLGELKAISQQSKESREALMVYTPTNDPKDGFEALYLHNKWTDEQLVNQRSTICKMKWCFIALTLIAAGSLPFWAVFAWGQRWFFLFSCIFTLMMVGAFAVRAVQFGLYQTQIDERALYKLKDFWGRGDFWARMFSF